MRHVSYHYWSLMYRLFISHTTIDHSYLGCLSAMPRMCIPHASAAGCVYAQSTGAAVHRRDCLWLIVRRYPGPHRIELYGPPRINHQLQAFPWTVQVQGECLPRMLPVEDGQCSCAEGYSLPETGSEVTISTSMTCDSCKIGTFKENTGLEQCT